MGENAGDKTPELQEPSDSEEEEASADVRVRRMSPGAQRALTNQVADILAERLHVARKKLEAWANQRSDGGAYLKRRRTRKSRKRVRTKRRKSRKPRQSRRKARTHRHKRH